MTKDIPKKILGYTVRSSFSEEARNLYFQRTEKGLKLPPYLPGELNLEVGDLLFAHAVAAREPHPLLEGLWVDGMADYPLGVLLLDYLRQDHETFLRRRPVYERCYRLCAKARGHWPYDEVR